MKIDQQVPGMLWVNYGSEIWMFSLGMSLSLTKFEYSNIVEFSLVTQTRTPEIDLLNDSFDMV